MSNLVHAALHGRLAVLDGIDQLSGGTLSTLQRLIADRDITLPDGTRLLRADRYDSLLRHGVSSGLTAEGSAAPRQAPAAKCLAACVTDRSVACALSVRGLDSSAAARARLASLRIMRVHPAFRIIALARPATFGAHGAGKPTAWLTPEVLAMFLYHYVRPLSEQEETEVLLTLAPRMDRERLHQLLAFANLLRRSTDEVVMSLASALSTRYTRPPLRLGNVTGPAR